MDVNDNIFQQEARSDVLVHPPHYRMLFAHHPQRPHIEDRPPAKAIGGTWVQETVRNEAKNLGDNLLHVRCRRPLAFRNVLAGRYTTRGLFRRKLMWSV